MLLLNTFLKCDRRARCKRSMDITHNSVKVKPGMKVMKSGGKSDHLGIQIETFTKMYTPF